MSPEWIATAVVASGALFEGWRRLRRFDRGWQEFRSDWQGAKARPGVPARKGVMERLADQDSELSFIRHELSFNSGLSVKDAVHRIDARMAEGNES